MKITATLERLAAYQSNELNLYATPNTDGSIANTYWAKEPNFNDDYPVANVGDFLENAGYSRGEITYDEVEALGDSVLTIEI